MACKDLSDDCASYATDGGCEDFAPLSSIGDIKRMCKASCGLCDRYITQILTKINYIKITAAILRRGRVILADF